MSDDLFNQPPNTEALLARIDASWAALLQEIEGRSEQELTRPLDGQDWSIRDHLVHITAWEHSLLGLLTGQDRRLAMGIDPAAASRKDVAEEIDTDTLNELVRQASLGQTTAQILERLHQSHKLLLSRLRALSDEDLMRPYSHYQPQDPTAPSDPVIGWIVGNTFGHYEEHVGWLKEAAPR
ncbi:MAG TPA: DinB family protein [Roseiflexaceae bacterium]|nr:DinB family protein [Roseiflexaceae bacterium]